MSKLKVTYFDFAGSRGEEVRLALSLAGQQFEDNRVNHEAFAKLKPNLPFGALPVFEVDGHGLFSQSNAILRLIGRLHGLHPAEPFEAARHDALMDGAEELRAKISPTMRMSDGPEKTAARKALATDYIPHWGRGVEGLIGAGPFVGGSKANVADIKLYMVDRWLSGGGVDDIPADILDPCPKLKALAKAVSNLPAVVAWITAKH